MVRAWAANDLDTAIDAAEKVLRAEPQNAAILRHLRLPTDLPVPRPARAPPLSEAGRDVAFGGGTDVADVEPC